MPVISGFGILCHALSLQPSHLMMRVRLLKCALETQTPGILQFQLQGMHGTHSHDLIMSTCQGGQDMTASPANFNIPETFSFGLEDRPEEIMAVKLDVPDAPDCKHHWIKRDPPQQTLRHEGKTIVECRQCKRAVTVYDWKIKGQGD